MMQVNLQDNSYWLLMTIALRAKHELPLFAGQQSLSAMQIFILCSLEPQKNAAMNSLSALMMCDASNVTGIIDRLQTQGYVTRTECPSDRRVKQVMLTSSGEALRARVIERFIETHSSNLESLTEDERQTFNRLLKKVVAQDCAR